MKSNVAMKFGDVCDAYLPFLRFAESAQVGLLRTSVPPYLAPTRLHQTGNSSNGAEHLTSCGGLSKFSVKNA